MVVKPLKIFGLFIIITFALTLIDISLTASDSDLWDGYGHETEFWERILARGLLVFIGLLIISVSTVEVLTIFGVKNIVYKSVKAYSEYSVKFIANAVCLYFSIIIYIVVFYLPYKFVVWLFF